MCICMHAYTNKKKETTRAEINKSHIQLYIHEYKHPPSTHMPTFTESSPTGMLGEKPHTCKNKHCIPSLTSL